MKQLQWLQAIIHKEKEKEIVIMTFGHPIHSFFTDAYFPELYQYSTNILKRFKKFHLLTTWICGGCGAFPIQGVKKEDGITVAMNGIGFFGRLESSRASITIST
jgi:hypothetical protein